MTQDNQTYYLHYDQVGTLKAISDTNHNIVKEITYDTYGNILNDSNPDFKIPFGFAGGLQDPHTNLVHFGYREYDPQTGKWTTKDPIDFNGGDSNLYGYVLGDPVNLVDPEGLFSLNSVFLGTTIWFAIWNWEWYSAGQTVTEEAEIVKMCQDLIEQYAYSRNLASNNMCITDTEKINFLTKLAESELEMRRWCTMHVGRKALE